MKTITLNIPDGQRLGQAIMNAYRDRWLVDEVSLSNTVNIWERDTKDIQEAINKTL